MQKAFGTSCFGFVEDFEKQNSYPKRKNIILYEKDLSKSNLPLQICIPTSTTVQAY